MSTDQAAELTIYWKDNELQQTVKQVLKPFAMINIDIMSEFDLNMKKLKLTVRLFQKKTTKNEIFFVLFLFINRHDYVIQMQNN